MKNEWPIFGDEETAAVMAVLRSGKVNYWTGSEGREFEREFADFCGSKYAVAVSNGTVALEIALKAGGIGPDDEVIVTPRTFIASASCIIAVGARPVFADIDPDTQNITAASVRAVLTDKTRGVIAVHHAGWPCEMDELMSLAGEHRLLVVEDCAQAHGARYKGRPVGSLGHIGAFSFCQDKIMTLGGEGGMLVTNDSSIWNKAWSQKDHGKNHATVFSDAHPPGFRWLHESFGTNARMTEMQAAIGRIQLRKLPEWKRLRTRNAETINTVLRKYSHVRVPEVPDYIEHAYYRQYAFIQPGRPDEGRMRDAVIAHLAAKGYPAFVGSCPEIYNEKAFAGLGLRPDRPLPIASSLGPTSLAMLVHPTLSDSYMIDFCAELDSAVAALQ